MLCGGRQAEPSLSAAPGGRAAVSVGENLPGWEGLVWGGFARVWAQFRGKVAYGGRLAHEPPATWRRPSGYAGGRGPSASAEGLGKVKTPEYPEGKAAILALRAKSGVWMV